MSPNKEMLEILSGMTCNAVDMPFFTSTF